MGIDEITRRLEHLGQRRAAVNAERADILQEVRVVVRQAAAAGMSAAEIGRKVGMTREAVRLVLKDDSE